MGTTKRSFAGFVSGSARTVKVSMRVEEASRVADQDRSDDAENSALRSLTKSSLANSAATSRSER